MAKECTLTLSTSEGGGDEGKYRSVAGDPISIVANLEAVVAAMHRGKRRSFRTAALEIWLRAQVLLANLLVWFLRVSQFRNQRLAETDFRQIVVYTVGILGDNVVMLPALAALRKRYPRAAITVITNCQEWGSAAVHGLFGESQFVDQYFVVNDSLLRRCGLRFILDRSRLADLRCDLFVNLSPFGNRGWLGAVVREIMLAKMLRSSHAVGFRVSNVMRSPYNRNVYPNLLKNEPRRAAEVLKPLGIAPLAWQEAMPVQSEARESIRLKLASLGLIDAPFAVLHPGAKFLTQRWPARRFGLLAKSLLQEYGLHTIITGTKEEMPIVDEVLVAAGYTAQSLAQRTTISELTELLRMAKLCVSNDTGTMHLAAAVAVPTVAVFSMRNTLVHWFPNSENIRAVFRTCACRYCGLENTGCAGVECLNGIGVDDVMRAVRQLLSHAKF